MAVNNQPRIVGYDPNTGAPIYANPGGGAKVIKWVIIGILLVVLGVAGLIIYDNFFNLTKINLFQDAESYFEIEGYSGEGVLNNYLDAYQGPRVEGKMPYATQFYESIKYSANKTEGLKNGDKVIITATYDKSLARRAKLKAESDTMEFTVKDLKERYAQNGSDIEAENLAAIRGYMNDYVARDVIGSYNNKKSEGLVKLLYVSPNATESYEGDYEDRMIGFYKVTYEDTWEETRVTEYYACVMYPISKGPDYAKDIDQLVNDGDISIYIDSSDESLNSLVEEYKTYYNRSVVTELKTQ
jgi:hypothetical protein